MGTDLYEEKLDITFYLKNVSSKSLRNADRNVLGSAILRWVATPVNAIHPSDRVSHSLQQIALRSLLCFRGERGCVYTTAVLKTHESGFASRKEHLKSTFLLNNLYTFFSTSGLHSRNII